MKLKIKRFQNISLLMISLFGAVVPLKMLNDKSNHESIEAFSNTQQIMKVVSSSSQTYALVNTDSDKYGDEIWAWGKNNYGQLGVNEGMVLNPMKMEELPEGNIIDINRDHGVLIDSNDDGIAEQVWARQNSNWVKTNSKDAPIIDYDFGTIIYDSNEDGYGDEIYNDHNNLINNYWGAGVPVKVYYNGYHLLVGVDTNDNGMADELYDSGSLIENKPEGEIEDFQNYGDFDDNTSLTIGMLIEGELWMYGTQNKYGWLGNGTTDAPEGFNKVDIDAEIKQFSMGGYGYGHVLALTEDNEVYSWGYNYDGQLGISSKVNQYSPQLVTALPKDAVVKDIFTSDTVSGSIIQSKSKSSYGNQIYMWGNNTYGQFGNGTTDSSMVPVPTKVSDIPTYNWWFTTRGIVAMIAIILLGILLILLLIWLIIFLIKRRNDEEIDEQQDNYYDNQYYDDQYYN